MTKGLLRRPRMKEIYIVWWYQKGADPEHQLVNITENRGKSLKLFMNITHHLGHNEACYITSQEMSSGGCISNSKVIVHSRSQLK